MTQEEKLDSILKELIRTSVSDEYDGNKTMKMLCSYNGQVDLDEYKGLFERLKNDEFVTKEQNPKITSKGRTFWNNGGYVKQELSKQGGYIEFSDEEKIILELLRFLNIRVENYNITDEALRSQLYFVPDYQYNDILTDLVYKGCIGKKEIREKGWTITEDGQKEYSKLKNKKEEQENKSLSKDVEKTSKATMYLSWATFGAALLGAVGVGIQCFLSYQQNAKIERQTIILEMQENRNIEKPSTLQTSPASCYSKGNKNIKTEISNTTEITCPKCAHKKTEKLPTDVCVIKYTCEKCKTKLTPKDGDCCVFCTYGTHKCPSKQ